LRNVVEKMDEASGKNSEIKLKLWNYISVNITWFFPSDSHRL
jgi:hypothetical protein